MPHISIEYSRNLENEHDLADLVADVHDAALTSDAIPLAALRTRAHRCDHVRIANGDDDLAFVAIVIRLGPGRSSEVKSQLVSSILDAAERTFADGPFHIAFSCEVQEIDPTMRENRNHIRNHLEAGQS